MTEALAIVNKLLHESVDDPGQYLDWLGRKEELGGLENVGFGILIHTSPEDLIEQNAQEDGIPTDQPFWDKINADVERIERNALAVLGEAGITVSSEGHDGHTQALAATGWLMQKNAYDEDKRLGILKGILATMEGEAPSTSSGTMNHILPGATEKLYQGVSEFGYLIDVTIEFFGNELKEWAELNLTESLPLVHGEDLPESIDLDDPTSFLSNYRNKHYFLFYDLKKNKPKKPTKFSKYGGIYVGIYSTLEAALNFAKKRKLVNRNSFAWIEEHAEATPGPDTPENAILSNEATGQIYSITPDYQAVLRQSKIKEAVDIDHPPEQPLQNLPVDLPRILTRLAFFMARGSYWKEHGPYLFRINLHPNNRHVFQFWHKTFGTTATASLPNDLFYDTYEGVLKRIKDQPFADASTILHDLLPKIRESSIDADPVTYLNQIHDYDDLARDLTNYGLFVQRTKHWGRWIILAGAAYWAINSKTGEALTPEFFERQLDRFVADLGITQSHFKVNPPDAKGHIYYRLALPKSQITWETWQRFAINADPDVADEVPEWLPEGIEPFRQPDEISCGPSVIHMLNRALGQTNRSFEQIGKLTHTNRVWGSLPVFMTSALRKLGLPFEKRRITSTDQLTKELEGAVCAVLTSYEGIPHWILVTGLAGGNFTVNDPAEGAVVYTQERMAAALDRSTLSGLYRAVGFMLGTAYRLTCNVNEAIDPDDPEINVERHTAGLDLQAIMRRLGFSPLTQLKTDYSPFEVWIKQIGNREWRVWPTAITNVYEVTRLERPAKYVQVGRGRRYGQWSEKNRFLCHVSELEQQLREEGALTEAFDPDAPEPAIERFAQNTEQAELKLEATINAALQRFDHEVERRGIEDCFDCINLADNLAAEIGNEMAEQAGYPNGSDEFDWVVSAVNDRASVLFPDPDTLEAGEPPPVQEEQDIDPETYVKSQPLEVLARVTDDTTGESVRFNCAAWFEQASLEQVLTLAREEWQRGYAADEVARFFSDTTLQGFFERENSGFEVRISIEDAQRWIEFNRPEWMQHFDPDNLMAPLQEAAADPDDPAVNVERHMASMDAGKILTGLGFNEWWPSWKCADPTYMGWQKWNRGLKWFVQRKNEDTPQTFEVRVSQMRITPGVPFHDYVQVGGFTCHVGELETKLRSALQQPKSIFFLQEATDPDDPSINIERHTADLDLEAVLTKLGFVYDEESRAWQLDAGYRRVKVWPTEVPQVVTFAVGELRRDRFPGSDWYSIEMDRSNIHITKLPARLRSRGLVSESQSKETVDYPAVWVTGRIFIGPSHYHIVSQLQGNGIDVSDAHHGWWTSHCRFLDSDSDLNDLIELDPRFAERSGEDPGVRGEELPKAKQLTGVRQVHEGLDDPTSEYINSTFDIAAILKRLGYTEEINEKGTKGWYKIIPRHLGELMIYVDRRGAGMEPNPEDVIYDIGVYTGESKQWKPGPFLWGKSTLQIEPNIKRLEQMIKAGHIDMRELGEALSMPDPDDPEMVLKAHEQGQIGPELKRLKFTPSKTKKSTTYRIHGESVSPHFWFKVMEAYGHKHAFYVWFHTNGFHVDVWSALDNKWHQGHPRLDVHPRTAGHAALILRDLYDALKESTEANLPLEQEWKLLHTRIRHHNQWYYDLAKNLNQHQRWHQALRGRAVR